MNSPKTQAIQFKQEVSRKQREIALSSKRKASGQTNRGAK